MIGHTPGRRRASTGALAAFALTATLLAGPTPAAAAADCRTQATGEELPDGTGRHPLIDLLGLRQAWDLSTGRGVTVGVIDSGVDATHPDLREAVVRGSEYEVVADEREYRRAEPPPEQDCTGHGTGVAGLVAARRAAGDRMAGVAPAATVYPVRFATRVEEATPRTIAAMIDDAVAAGARVLNLSFALPVDHEPVRDAVAGAVAANVVVVAAAGNESNQGVSEGRMYPAAYDDVLAVAAVGDDGQPLSTSNAGPWVDLAAYGENLTVVAPGGTGYRTENGNSFAAAQVSGAAALVRSRFPDLTAAEVADRLTASATPLAGGVNDHTGAGLVDPFGALTHLQGPDPTERSASPGHVPVQPVPRPEPPLSSAAVSALTWSGGLLLAVLLALLAAPAVRRAAARRWRPGAEEPPPAAPPRPAEPEPAGVRLAWLDGAPTTPKASASPTHPTTQRHRTPYGDDT